MNGTSEPQPATFAFAMAPFTGGSTSARPTSVDEWTYAPVSSTAIHDNTASNYRLHMVYATRGDFWLWIHKVGLASPATQPAYWAMVATQVTPYPGVVDNYPVVTSIFGGAFGFRYDNIFAPGTTTSGWRGRTAHGALVTMCGATMTSITSYPLAYIPTAGGYITKSFPRLPLQIWSYEGTANGYSDYKGAVVDVQVGPWGCRPGAPDSVVAVTRRLYGNVWLPGVNIIEPNYA